VLGTLLVLWLTGCGARTGLPIPELDAGSSEDGCTTFRTRAELAPVDVFLLLDASRSMGMSAADGETKWQAVRGALSGFFRDDASRGLGIALTFFPLVQQDVPVFCVRDADCGPEGTCLDARGCQQSNFLCNTRIDCVVHGNPDDQCRPIGFCPRLGLDVPCSLDDPTERPPGCGECMPLGTCDNRSTCDPAPYASPAVGVEPLPSGTDALLRTFDAQEQTGGTPTLPALQGTVDGAIGWSRANPTHKVVTVLATDGFPTACDPDLRSSLDEGIGNVADAAARGLENDIETFVIGVFGNNGQEFAQDNLDRIARAGGTERAFITSPSDGASEQFLEALNRVRVDATSCELALQQPIPVTESPARGQITRRGEDPVALRQVDDATACTEGGFYYTEVAGGEASRVALCPSTCATFESSLVRDVELTTDC
jgi:Mg-chelatase subunit ChlD